MRLRNTLLLLLVLIGLAVYVVNVERPAAVKEATKEKLLDFKPEDVTELVLAAPDREVVLVKTDGLWKITKPITADADDMTVKGVLSLLSAAEVKKGLEGEVKDLGTYGLEKPNTTLTLKAGAKTLPVVKIGDAAPFGGSAYALRGDDKKILLTTTDVRGGVDKSVKDLLSKSILRFGDDAVRKVEIKGADRDLLLVRGDGDTWKIEAAKPRPAEVAAVRTYLSTLRSLRAIDFPDETAALSTYSLDVPRLVVDVTLADGTTQTLLVGGSNDKKEVFAKTATSPVIYTVGEYVGRDLEKPAGDFRDKAVVAVDKDKIGSIVVTRKDAAPFTIAKDKDGKWTIDPAPEKPAAQGAMAAYANDVGGLKGFDIAGEDVTSLGTYGLDAAPLRIDVHGVDGADLGTIVVALREGDGQKAYYAARAGGDTVFLVRDTQFVRLDKSANDFGEKAPAAPANLPPGVQLPDGIKLPPGVQMRMGGGEEEGDEDLGAGGDGGEDAGADEP